MTSTALRPHRAPSAAEVDAAAAVLAGRRFAVLTGAGVSTDSGIPDYRGAGAPVRTPMNFATFLSDESARRRYWAGSHLGWQQFAAAQPNRAHRQFARWEAAGHVTGLVTQNVDGLHRRAGSERVVELHGALDQVSCLSCGQRHARVAVAERIAENNPWLDRVEPEQLAPDGDAIPAEVHRMVVPVCTVCGGPLKPDVVFFGEFVPAQTFAEARRIVQASDAFLVAGSSLAVNSGIRLLEVARRQRIPIVIVNSGPTKGDSRALVKIDAGVTETLDLLAARL